MATAENLEGEITIDNFFDINIDMRSMGKRTDELNMAKSEVEQQSTDEMCISAEPLNTCLVQEKSLDIEDVDSLGMDEVLSTTSVLVDSKHGSIEKLEPDDAECLTSLRKFVLEKILANGKVDVSDMKCLLECRDLFEKNVVLNCLDLLKVDNMFSVLPKLVISLETFTDELKQGLDKWSEDCSLCQIYYDIMLNLPMYFEYINFTAAVLNILQSGQDIEVYNTTMKKVMPKTEGSFSDLLHSPIVALNRIYFGLKELCKYTSHNHPDYHVLNEIRFCMRRHPSFVPPQINKKLHLIKSGYVIELDKNKRKLRFLFLFPKNLIITKLKMKSNCALYHTKGIIRLGKRMVTLESTDDIDDALENSVRKVKKSLMKYQRHLENTPLPSKKCPHISWKSDYARRRFHKLEASLALMSPRMRLTLTTTVDKKFYQFLFFSRVEFETWKDLIENHDYSYTDILTYLNCIKNYGVIPKMIDMNIANNPLNYYEGILDVYLHQIKGMVSDTDIFITLQVDCFGGYFTKVYTSDITKMGRDPSFNQKFEISLNCSQILRISAYKCVPDTLHEFKFFATGTYELQSTHLDRTYSLVAVPLLPSDTRVHLSMSLRLFSHEFNEERKRNFNHAINEVLRVWRMRGKVFGENLRVILKREDRKIPLIVTSCVEEIEKRGLDSSFIYVMRGDDTRVNDLVSVFDICSFTGSHYIKQKRYTPYDITEVLTRYLRALPYPILLCPNNYLPVFNLEDIPVKVKMISFLLTNIPEPGRSVFSYLLDHMARVCLNEPRNRVTPSILGGIFSPVILDSDVSLTLEEYIRKRNHFATILNCMITMKLQGYTLDCIEL